MEEKLRKAIEEALEVLGKEPCPENHCQGCEVEREEARRILDDAIRLED